MALRRTGRTGTRGGSGAPLRALLLFHAVLAVSLLSVAAARAEDPDMTLAGSGIRYPGGYDPDTAGEIHGKAFGTSVPEKGPVFFRLDTGRERYTVLASPQWYWKDLRVDLPDGSDVKVLGSKTLGKDMALYVIAREVRLSSSGKTWVFRDGNGYPLWKGRGGAAPGGGMGSASPMRRGGGFGGGPGGQGGRKR